MKSIGGLVKSCGLPEEAEEERKRRAAAEERKAHDTAAVRSWGRRRFHPSPPASDEKQDPIDKRTYWVKGGPQSEYEEAVAHASLFA